MDMLKGGRWRLLAFAGVVAPAAVLVAQRGVVATLDSAPWWVLVAAGLIVGVVVGLALMTSSPSTIEYRYVARGPVREVEPAERRPEPPSVVVAPVVVAARREGTSGDSPELTAAYAELGRALVSRRELELERSDGGADRG